MVPCASRGGDQADELLARRIDLDGDQAGRSALALELVEVDGQVVHAHLVLARGVGGLLGVHRRAVEGDLPLARRDLEVAARAEPLQLHAADRAVGRVVLLDARVHRALVEDLARRGAARTTRRLRRRRCLDELHAADRAVARVVGDDRGVHGADVQGSLLRRLRRRRRRRAAGRRGHLDELHAADRAVARVVGDDRGVHRADVLGLLLRRLHRRPVLGAVVLARAARKPPGGAAADGQAGQGDEGDREEGAAGLLRGDLAGHGLFRHHILVMEASPPPLAPPAAPPPEHHRRPPPSRRRPGRRRRPWPPRRGRRRRPG